MLKKCINYTLCLGNISKDLAIDYMKKKNRTNKKFFPVDFNAAVTNILDIHK